MARKRTVRTAPAPTAERVDAATRKGDFATAVDLAKRLVAFDSKPHNEAILRQTLLRAAQHYLNTDQFQVYLAIIRDAQQQKCTDADWLRSCAVMMAKGGQVVQAEVMTASLNDPTLKAKLTGHYVDWLVRERDPAAVNEEQRPAFDAITKGFLHYQAGKDEAAREALNAIGLSSPFLEWKLLLRGLIAWSSNDDARAVENFSRLNPERLPFQLAAPIRIKIDPAFIANQPESTAGTYQMQYRSLHTGGVLSKLRKLQPELARQKKLKSAFKAAESIIPLLKTYLPHALPRLANCFYHAIVKHGEQDDLPRFRKLFGPPTDDPQFYKLEALVYEEIGEKELALQRWSAYEGWLSTPPPLWPKPLADRARAVILNRLGTLAIEIENEATDPDPFEYGMGGFFAAANRRKQAKAKPLDPTVFLKRSVDLAPDWEPPARELFHRAVEADRLAEAEAVARKFLRHNPQAVFFLNELAKLLIQQGRSAEGLELRIQSLAVNPLDAQARHQTAAAHLAHARRLAIGGKPKDAQAALDAAQALLISETKTSYHALQSTLFRKLGDPAQADEHTAAGLTVPGARLAMRLYLMANAVLLKLKPADKTAANKAYTAALAEPLSPKEASMLIAGWDMYHQEGLTYTGQKTQEKKIYDAAVRAADGEGLEIEFEGLAILLNTRNQYTLVKKLAPKLARRFPKNPVFPYCLAQAELGKSSRAYGYKISEPLRKAKALAEASEQERHKGLLPIIEELLKKANPFGSLLNPFAFGGFFGGGEEY